MSARGRKRTGQNPIITPAVQTLGVPQEDIPVKKVQPPPLYPPLQFKPRPLLSGEEQNYLANLREEMREKMRQYGHYIPSDSDKKDVGRYSDKSQPWNLSKELVSDRSLFPAELFEEEPPKKKKQKPAKLSIGKASTSATDVVDNVSAPNVADIDGLLTDKPGETGAGEKNDDTFDDEIDEKSEEEEEEKNDDDEDDDLEEGADYTANYYENEENYLDDSEDNLEDSPVY